MTEFDWTKMPCYTPWFHYLNNGTPDYTQKRLELEAKFHSLKHIVDYYFASFEKEMVDAKYRGFGMNYEIEPSHDPLDEARYEAICRHMACDGLYQDDLYDVESILNRDKPKGRNYAYVLMQCSMRLRSSSRKYRPKMQVDRICGHESNDRIWFVSTPH